jgi:hemolysin activation/secretion protein
MSHRSLFLVSSLFALSLASCPAFAQPVSQVAEPADPGRAQQQLPLKTDNLPPARMEAAPSLLQPQAMPEGANAVRFTLNAVIVDNMSVYDADSIRPLIDAQLGETVSMEYAFGLAQALTERYRKDGYILSRVVVPPQTIKDGRLHLTAIEGKIGDVETDLPESLQTDLVKAQVKTLTAQDGPAQLKDLERALLILNDLPGAQISSALSPGDRPGTSKLTLTGTEKTVEGRAAIDNYGSKYLGPWQGAALLALNNLRGKHDRIELQAGAAPRGTSKPELGFLGLKFTEPLGDAGTFLETSTFYAATQPGEILKDLDVRGSSEFASLGLKHPILRGREHSLWGRIAFDARSVQSESAVDIPRQDDLRVVRLGLTETFLTTNWGLAHNVLDLEVSKGIGGLGASKAGDPYLTRAEGKPQFLKMVLEGQRLQALTGKLNALFGIKGQKSSDPLLTAEEVGLGGFGGGYGRGYDPSEIAGDDALAGKLELQWNTPEPVSFIDGYQVYGFYDIGAVWNQDASDPSLAKRSLASTGAGLRVNLTPLYEADLSVAVPLTRDVEFDGDKAPRFYLSVARNF